MRNLLEFLHIIKPKNLNFNDCEVYSGVKKNTHLIYRKDGDIDYDPDSREPYHVAYNNAREIIRRAKIKGEWFAVIQLSNATEEALRKDGYRIEYRKNCGEGDIVKW